MDARSRHVRPSCLDGAVQVRDWHRHLGCTNVSECLGEFARRPAGHVGLVVSGVVDDLPLGHVLRGHRCGSPKDRCHHREVPRGNDTDTVVASKPVQFGIVVGRQPAGADHHVHAGLNRSPHVVAHCRGTGVVDKNVDLGTLQRVRDAGVHGSSLPEPVTSDRGRPAADRDTPAVSVRSSASSMALMIGGAVQPVTPAKHTFVMGRRLSHRYAALNAER